MKAPLQARTEHQQEVQAKILDKLAAINRAVTATDKVAKDTRELLHSRTGDRIREIARLDARLEKLEVEFKKLAAFFDGARVMEVRVPIEDLRG